MMHACSSNSVIKRLKNKDDYEINYFFNSSPSVNLNLNFLTLDAISTPPCCYNEKRRKSSNCLSAQSPDMDLSRYHSASSLSKYQTSSSNLLVPPNQSKRRHSIGERLAAALHL